MPSYPANFSSGPKYPPEFAAPIVPVNGAFATTLNLPAQVAYVPVTGPVMKMSLFSGLNASI